MSTDLAPMDSAAVLERVIVVGDLEQLSPAERVRYYRAVCESLGLNPLTRPFEYLKLSGKLILYARKDATEQLRHKRGISISKLEHEVAEGVYIVTAYARDAGGREDSDIGVVPIDNLRGEARANAIMKATTKSKRRVTLSICGLGMLDESELDGVPAAKHVRVDMATGEILEGGASPVEDAGRGISDRPEPSTAAPPPLQEEDKNESETMRSILLGEISAIADKMKMPVEARRIYMRQLLGDVKIGDATLDQLRSLHDSLLTTLESKQGKR